MSGGGSGARRIGVALLLTVLALTVPGLAFVYGSTQSAPRPRPAGVPPPDLALRPVRIARGASYVAAWFDAAPQRRASVMLVHGIRSSRHSMLERARFLGRAGYAVLLVDLQAHGETPGEAITFGYRESRDVAAAARWLRSRSPERPVYAIGVSMGGAAIVLADPPLPFDAVVLESVYSRIGEAIGNRLAARFGVAGRLLVPLMTLQLEPRLGVSEEALSPLDRIAGMRAPLLVLGGGDDRRTRPDETRALHRRAPVPKSLWIVEGAGHQDLHAFARAGYERRVLEFFEAHR